MSELLRGNFATKRPVQDEAPQASLEEQFEIAALKRLGGSITFVAKKKVMWDLAAPPDDKTRE
jgi:hypothetical protein